MKNKLAILTTVSLLLTGCASFKMTLPEFLNNDQTPVPLENKNQQQAELDRLMQHRLLEAAASIDTTLKLIERIEKGSTSSPQQAQAGKKSTPVASPTGSQNAGTGDELSVRLKIVWKDGPADELLAKLSSQLGFSYKETGKRKKLPLVSIDTNGETARVILERIGNQINQQADIVLHKNSNPATLELRYK